MRVKILRTTLGLLAAAGILAAGCGDETVTTADTTGAETADNDVNPGDDIAGSDGEVVGTPVDTTGTEDVVETDGTGPVDCDRVGFGAIDRQQVEFDSWGYVLAAASVGTPWNALLVEFHGSLGVGSYQLGDNYEDCMACVRLLNGCTSESCAEEYLATEGRLEVTRADGNGGRFEGRVVNAKFKQVSWEDADWGQWVADSPTWCVDQLSFSAPVAVGEKNYELLNQQSTSDRVGGDALGTRQAETCPDGYVAIEISGNVAEDNDGADLMAGLSMRCGNLDAGPVGTLSLAGRGTIGVMGEGGLVSESVCPSGQIMVGVGIGKYEAESDVSLSGVAARCTDIHAWVDTSMAAPAVTTEWHVGTVGSEGFECPRGSAIVELRSDVSQETISGIGTYVRIHTIQAVCRRLGAL